MHFTFCFGFLCAATSNCEKGWIFDKEQQLGQHNATVDSTGSFGVLGKVGTSNLDDPGIPTTMPSSEDDEGF